MSAGVPHAVIVLSDDDDPTPALAHAAELADGSEVRVVVAGTATVFDRHGGMATSARRPRWLTLDASMWCRLAGLRPDSVRTQRNHIHHVFPKKWCLDNKIDHLKRESIVNKTAISAATNRKIGGRAPSKYLPILLKEAETTDAQLQEHIEQHHVSYESLASDDFEGYFEHRRQRLLDLIG